MCESTVIAATYTIAQSTNCMFCSVCWWCAFTISAGKWTLCLCLCLCGGVNWLRRHFLTKISRLRRNSRMVPSKWIIMMHSYAKWNSIKHVHTKCGNIHKPIDSTHVPSRLNFKQEGMEFKKRRNFFFVSITFICLTLFFSSNCFFFFFVFTNISNLFFSVS